MSDLFAGLEGFGLKDTKEIEVYENKKENKDDGTEGTAEEKSVLTEEDFLFDKTYKCPVCDREFKSKMVRSGKVRLLAADSDLRPKYQGVDSLKYDAVLCPKCGYAALNRYFNFVMDSQAKEIKTKISRTFKDNTDNSKAYDYDTAIARHKMALLNTVVKRGKNSERAYTCLKIAWLYRGKREQLESENFDKDELKKLEETELEFLTNAYEGFKESFSKESFPMCGMDQYTVMYLIAELARRSEDIEVSKQWISRVLIARDCGRRIKDKAFELKEKLQAIPKE